MKNKILKIVAVIIAVVLIILILVITNAFTGNPISGTIATNKIEKYIEKTYPNNDFTVEKAKFNFKFSEYFCVVKSKASPDTTFSVSYRSGNLNDKYKYEVANKFTTYRRISDELNSKIKEIVAKDFAYKTDMVIGDFLKADDESLTKNLKLDMTLDINNPPLPISVSVYVYEENRDIETLAKRIFELDNIMASNNIYPQIYSLVLVKEDGKYLSEGSIGIHDFSSDNLKKDNFIDILTQQINKQNSTSK